MTAASRLILSLSVFMMMIGFAYVFAINFEVDRALRSRMQRISEPLAMEHRKPQESLLYSIAIFIGLFIVRSGLLSFRTVDETRQTLRSAGLRNDLALGLFIGLKALLFGICILLALGASGLEGLAPGKIVLAGSIAGIFGLIVPDFVLKIRRRKFLKKIEAGLAEALDMLIICSDAGLGLEGGLQRVAVELETTHSAIAEELKITIGEMRLADSTSDALVALGTRTGLDSLKRLGTTLVQSMQYGTPITQALRTLSAELREEQLTRFEERAARLPVLLTVPMILFILPCVFLIVGGPAALGILGVMHHH